MIISVCDRVENIVGKGENAGYQHFLLFPQCFKNAFFPGASKGVIECEWVNTCSYYCQYDRVFSLCTLLSIYGKKMKKFGEMS